MINIKERDIIIVEAHPDDAFIGLYETMNSGELFKGCHLVTVTRGEYYFATESAWNARGEVRSKETQRFVDAFDVRHHTQLDLHDRFVDWEEARYELTQVFHLYSDPLIFCHSFTDRHPDHRAVYKACLTKDRVSYCIDTPQGYTTTTGLKWDVRDLKNEHEKKEAFLDIYPSQEYLFWSHPGVIDRFSKNEILVKELNVEKTV